MDLTKEIDRIDRRIARARVASRQVSRLRVALFVVSVAIGIVVFRAIGSAAGWWAVAALLVVFIVLARYHGRLEGRLERWRRWRTIRVRHQARLEQDWSGLPEPPTPQAGSDHPFASDLNLLGARSVHHLLTTAATAGGSRRLAEWLLATEPDLAGARRRQAAVRELVTASLFRDRLTLAGMESTGRANYWEDAPLRRFIDRARLDPSVAWWLAGLAALAAVNAGLFVYQVGLGGPALWPYTLAIYAFLYLMRWRSWKPLFDESYELDEMLSQVEGPLGLLERTPFGARPAVAPFLAAVRGENSPSRRLRRLRRITLAAGISSGELMRLVLNVLVPWDLFFAWLLDRMKADLKQRLPAWLDVWYDAEALSALAAWAYFHPEASFPELREASHPSVHATAMGHPLLSEVRKVRNDLSMGHEILLITGSNMSGKSTFLRTLGVNLALAYAGGAVDATAFHATGFRLFTCMNVSDSVQDGLSYFYAEVRRLKALLDAANVVEAPPLLFLIDEIFRGTNNRERLAGSLGYIHALAESPAAGMIATHDLELTRLEGEIPSLRNAHFREEVVGDEMVFDYRIHPGPCPTTNALVIMRLAGLPA